MWFLAYINQFMWLLLEKRAWDLESEDVGWSIGWPAPMVCLGHSSSGTGSPVCWEICILGKKDGWSLKFCQITVILGKFLKFGPQFLFCKTDKKRFLWWWNKAMFEKNPLQSKWYLKMLIIFSSTFVTILLETYGYCFLSSFAHFNFLSRNALLLSVRSSVNDCSCPFTHSLLSVIFLP